MLRSSAWSSIMRITRSFSMEFTNGKKAGASSWSWRWVWREGNEEVATKPPSPIIRLKLVEKLNQSPLELTDDQLQFKEKVFWNCKWNCHSQKKATDPTRFTNRGGNLLKEEKQRSELHKSLPKVTHGHLSSTDLKMSFRSATHHHVSVCFSSLKSN